MYFSVIPSDIIHFPLGTQPILLLPGRDFTPGLLQKRTELPTGNSVLFHEATCTRGSHVGANESAVSMEFLPTSTTDCDGRIRFVGSILRRLICTLAGKQPGIIIQSFVSN